MSAEESIAHAVGPGETARPSPEFRVGRVLTRACRIGLRRSPIFLPIAAIAVLPYSQPVERHLQPWTGSLTVWLVTALFLVIVAVVECVIVHAVFAEICDRKAGLRVSIRDGLARGIANIAIEAAQTVAIYGGLLLLVAPGLIAASRLYVSTSVCVIEKRGMIASVRRSAELTRGHRWRVLALFLSMLLVQTAGDSGLSPVVSLLHPLAGEIAGLFWTTVCVVLDAVIGTVAYHDLRVAKEGLVGNRFAAVFD